MKPIFIIIIYTFCIIPYNSIFKEFKKFYSDIEGIFTLFIEQFKNSKGLSKFLYLILIVFISILVLILSPIFALTFICYHTLKTNLNNIHANVYKYFIMPYIFTSFLVLCIIKDHDYGISLSIIKEYFNQLSNLFTQNTVIQFFVVLLIMGGISLFLNLFPKYFFSENHVIEKNFWDLIKLLFNSSILTLTFLTFLGSFFIFTDTVTSDLTQKFNISFFDVYSTLSLYYASCILLVQIVFNLSIKPFIESRKQNDNLL